MKKWIYNKSFIKAIFIIGMVTSLVVKGDYLHNTINLMREDLIHLIIPSALILVTVIALLFQRKAIYALIVTDLIVSIVFFADVVYGRYYGIPLTIPIIYQVGFMGDVADSTFSLIKWQDLVFLFPYPFMIGYAVFFKKTLTEKRKWIENGILGLLLVTSIAYFTYEASQMSRLHHAYERKYIARDLGVFYFHGYDIVDFTKSKWVTNTALDADELNLLDTYLEENPQIRQTDSYALGKKNLVVVQVEAMQGFVVDLEIEGEEVTPFLNQLKNQGLYFDSIYHQVAAGNTSDAELMTNTGLYPAPVGAVNYLHSGNTFETLPNMLEERGYTSLGFHGYQASFWNREVIYNLMGFDDFVSKEDLVLDEILGWAISDASFFRQAMDFSIPKAPFYSFLVTLSSHHPYDAFRGMQPDTGALEETQVGDYLKSMRYVDTELENLFKRLEAEGILQETIVVIYGDHAGLYQDQKEVLNHLLDLQDHVVEWEQLQKVPLWIVAPGVEKTGVISKVGGQVDILPTLCDLLDLQATFLLGDSLLDQGPGYAIKRDGSIYFEDSYYHNGTQTLYDISSLEPLELTADKLETIERIKLDLKVSDLILKKNLFTNSEFIKLVD